MVDIKGLDITSLPRTGILNYEHKSDIPGQICGKILSAKKIFSKNDCENEHELYFWEKCKNPFVYITAELLDDYCQSGKDAAGLLKYSKDNPDKFAILGFSVEGSEIPNTRKGMLITRSIARKVTLTSAPCNSQCVAELLIADAPKSQVKDDFDSLFKSNEEAITLFKSGEGVKIYENYLAKKEAEPPNQGGDAPKSPYSEYENQGIRIGTTKSGKHVFSHGHVGSYDFNPAEHKEAAEHHQRAAVTADNPKLADNHIQRMTAHNNAAISGGRQENRAALSLKQKDKVAMEQGKQQMAKEEDSKLEKSWGPGKVSGDSVHYSHPQHETVSIQKQPTGEFHVKHQGKLAGVGGVKGVFSGAKEAGAHAKKYMAGLTQGKIVGPKMHNIPSGANAVIKSDLKKALEAGSTNAAPSTLTNGAAYQSESLSSSQSDMGEHNFKGTKKKDWNKRAKEDYKNWPEREKFEKFMSARMPHLKLGEIQAIGRTVALKKSFEAEKLLKSLVPIKKSKK